MKKFAALCLCGMGIIGVVCGRGQLDETSYLFQENLNLSLYPEIDYQRNPGALHYMLVPLMLSDLEFSIDRTQDTQQRIDDSVGAKDGTETIVSQVVLPQAGLSMFAPAGEDVFGISLGYASEHLLDTIDRYQYNLLSENKLIESRSDAFDFEGELYYALGLGDRLNLGISGGYAYGFDPKVFRTVTDRSQDPSLIYYDTTADPDTVDRAIQRALGGVGITMPSDGGDFSIGALYSGYFINDSDEYKAVDTDGDGYAETLYSLKDYYFLATADGGPTNTASGFDHQDYSHRHRVEITSFLKIPLSESVSFLMDGAYPLLDTRKDYAYLRVLDDQTVSDVSYQEQIFSSGLGSFDALVGLIFNEPGGESELRLGLGYALYNQDFSQNGDSAAGLNLYSSLNPEHYTEMSLGLDPANNSLSGSGIYPETIQVHEITFDIGMNWYPVDRFALFFTCGISGYTSTQTYRAFNLDTRSSWEETVTSGSLTWRADSMVGVAFPIDENLSMTVNLKNLTVLGGSNSTGETQPYDLIVNRYSDNTSFLLGENDFSLDINLGFMGSW